MMFVRVSHGIVSAAEFLTQTVYVEGTLLRRPSNVGNKIEQSQRIK